MVYSIALSLSLLLHVYQIGGGFLRFNDPAHMTAPLDLEDLDSGSYDELIKFNPSLAAPFENIRYGGDPNKPFDWSAPEIEAQNVELVLEPNESMFIDEKGEIAKENRDEVNRARRANISKDIRDETYISAEKNRGETDITAVKNRVETDITAEENNETDKKIAEKNRSETDIIAEKIRDKSREKHLSLKYFANYPVWFSKKTTANVQEKQTDVQEFTDWNNLINNETINRKTDSFPARILDLNITQPRRSGLNIKKILRQQVRPKTRSYKIEVPWHERTNHDHHIAGWSNKNTHDYDLTGTYIASCYRCGELNYGKWWRPSVEKRERNGKVLPTGGLCYEAFEGDDWTSKTKARHLRTRCYNNVNQTWKYEIGDDNYNYYHECVSPNIYPWLVNRTYDKGNPMECFGRYTGKCFKRFLDVGRVTA